MKFWTKHTCLRFRQVTTEEKYVYFTNSRGCNSYIGMLVPNQTIGLARGCREAGIIAHEIGHAVGFFHEHKRPDRDASVKILFENTAPGTKENFIKINSSDANTYSVPYDYGSLMHYGGHAGSKNGKLTIKTLDASKQKLMGQKKSLSFYDVKLANLMYSCDEFCNVSVKCPSYGFMAKDCRCHCPGNPTILCSRYTSPTTPPSTTQAPKKLRTINPIRCRDVNYHCKSWAMEGGCGTSGHMSIFCRKTCGHCVETQGYKANLIVNLNLNHEAPCIDHSDDCSKWRNMGYCNTDNFYRESMLAKCKKTCTQCDRSVEYSPKDIEKNGSANMNTGFSACILLSLPYLLFSGPPKVVAFC